MKNKKSRIHDLDPVFDDDDLILWSVSSPKIGPKTIVNLDFWCQFMWSENFSASARQLLWGSTMAIQSRSSNMASKSSKTFFLSSPFLF